MIGLVEAHRAQGGIAPLCDALGLARARFYRRRGTPLPESSAPRARRAPRQVLTPTERAGVLAVLHEEPFVDLPPAQVWAQLLNAARCRRARSARCTGCWRRTRRCASGATSSGTRISEAGTARHRPQPGLELRHH